MKIINKFDQTNIQKLITENFENLAPTYYRLLSEWMNSSYEVFNDIEKYRIILYLINKDFEYYITEFFVVSEPPEGAVEISKFHLQQLMRIKENPPNRYGNK